MEKVYIVMQSQYHEGNFGDCELSESEYVKGFYKREKAENFIKTLPEPERFEAQFGSGLMDYYIVELEIE